MPNPNNLASLNKDIQNLEYWNTFWGGTGVFLLALSFVAGFFAFWVGRQLNAKKDEVAAIDKIAFTKLEKELADAKTRQANAEKALNELAKFQAPRIINAFQKEALISELDVSSRALLEIYFKVNADDETRAYANQITTLLDAAGWKYNIGGIIMDNNSPDITISIPDLKKKTKAAKIIIKAFDKAQIKYSLYEDITSRQYEPNRLELWIGIKPRL